MKVIQYEGDIQKIPIFSIEFDSFWNNIIVSDLDEDFEKTIKFHVADIPLLCESLLKVYNHSMKINSEEKE